MRTRGCRFRLQKATFEPSQFNRYGRSKFKTLVTPMSPIKKLIVILAATIAAGCESQATTQGKQAIAQCDIYKTGTQYAEARSLVGNLGRGTATPNQIANTRYPTD